MRRVIYILFILIIVMAAFSVFLFKANLSYTPGIKESGTAALFDFLSQEDTKDEIKEIKEQFLKLREIEDQDEVEDSIEDKFLSATGDKVPIAVEKKIKIVVMPGHEPDWGGAEYYGLRERDFNVELGKHLYDFLREEEVFDVMLARDDVSFHSELEGYFADQWEEIEEFVVKSRKKMTSQILSGDIELVEGVPHADLPPNPATRLYGINKWSNENDIDILIHVHFNDYGGHRYNLPGEFSGFSIYVPERQFSNGNFSIALAGPVLESLLEYYPKSNLRREDKGVVEDQKLIAIGQNNTLDVASLIIEYGYIYEPQFQIREIRENVMWQMAYQTYKGILAFFGEDVSPRHYFLRKINQDLRYGAKNKYVLSLQFMLSKEGLLPPNGYSRHECKLDGFFGSCTVKAVKEFQKKYGLFVDGVVGPQTRKKLDEFYLELHQDVNQETV